MKTWYGGMATSNLHARYKIKANIARKRYYRGGIKASFCAGFGNCVCLFGSDFGAAAT